MNHILRPLRSGVKQLSKMPCAFDVLRWILEGGYHEHRVLLARHLSQAASCVLDLGCGTGIHAGYFDPEIYVGVDISPCYIARARQNFPRHRFEVMDAAGLKYVEHSFATVIISGVLHHLEETVARQVLGEVSRVLKPQGTLLLWEDVPTQNPYNLVGKLVHRLDVGEFIRPRAEYEELLSDEFCIESINSMRSGFMDYAVFKCRKRVEIETNGDMGGYRDPIEVTEDGCVR
jgi:SAM-dependent methyltransferase